MGALVAVIAAGCQTDFADAPATSEATALISTTTTVPDDGACAHVVATRLADFTVHEYLGPLTGGSLDVALGEHRVTATAFPAPCNAEPADAPWTAEQQLVTFAAGLNRVELRFHRAGTETTIDPVFDDESPLVRSGSRRRIGGAYEDAAGPGYAIDDWNIVSLAVPPATQSSTTLFRLAGSGLPYSPRGLAATTTGFVVQVSEPGALYFYDGTTPLTTWPVDYGADQIRWTYTDGLEAIDDTHFVRTGWLDTPVQCETTCVQAGIEVLELVTGPDGARARVTQQIALPPPYNTQFAVGVAAIGTAGTSFAVTVLDDHQTTLLLIDAAGTVLAASTIAPGVEGVFDAAGGRIGTLDYHGSLALYDATTAAPLGQTADYRRGIDLVVPAAIAWLPAPRERLVLASGADRRLVTVGPDGSSSPAYFPASYDNPSGLDYKADTEQLVITNRVPPIDETTNRRIPTVDFLSASTFALASSIQLRDVPLPVRTQSLAYLGSSKLIATIYGRPGAVPDAIDAVVYLHDLSGALVRTFSLAPYGFVDLESASYLASSDELLLLAKDFTGTRRLVVTTTTGTPVRSYRTDELDGPLDLAPMTDGPYAGDVGVLEDAGSYVRIRQP